MAKIKTKEEQHFEIFPSIIVNAINECNALYELFFNQMASLGKKYNQDFKELKKYFEEIGVEKGELSIPLRKYKKYKELSKKAFQDSRMIKMCPKFTISHLVQIYDSFLTKMLSETLFFYPGVFSLCEKALKLEKFKEDKSIDDVKRRFISFQVEELMRDSHVKQIEWIDKKLKTSIKSIASFKDFIFLTELRNIIIHNNGKINGIFKANLKKAGIHTSSYKNNTDIKLDIETINKSFDAVISLMVMIYASICCKLFKKEEPLITVLNNGIIYEYLSERNYRKVHLLASLLIDSGLIIHLGTLDVVKVNLAIAYMNSSINKYKNIVEELSDDNKDISLARAVLLEQYDLAAEIFKGLGNSKELYRGSFEWPLFDNFRKTEIFKQAFKEVFDEEFEIVREPETILEEPKTIPNADADMIIEEAS